MRSLEDVQEKVLTAGSPGERACAHACVAVSNLSLLQLPPLRSPPLPVSSQLDFLCHGALRCIRLRRCRLCLRCQCRCVHVCACTCAQCDGRKDEWTATPEVPPGVQHRVCMCVCACVCSCTHSFLACTHAHEHMCSVRRKDEWTATPEVPPGV